MSIDKYRNDALVVRSYTSTREVIPPENSTIGGIPSKKSLQRLVFILNNCDVPMTSMLTITLHDEVSNQLEVIDHRNLLRASLQRLRRSGASQYVWVREHQRNGTPHWHIFTDQHIDAGVDEILSTQWSRWVSEYCHKIIQDPALLRPLAFMSDGNGKDFIGCCRYEKLRDDAAGRYAGKEGAKRFQKQAPKKWKNSGAWWRASRNVQCTPIERVQVRTSSLMSTSVQLPDGTSIDVPFRLQFSRGQSCEG